MEDFFKKEDYIQADIESLIDNAVEENYYLDFKRSESLDSSDKKKMDISIDVSAFANTYGGILVYGIEEKNHVASDYSFITDKKVTKEWLAHIIQGRIQKPIPDLKIYPIRFDGKFEKTIYLVKIPQSIDAPHMASDSRFYKRDNYNNLRMQELDVRNTYNRLTKGNLEIENIGFNEDEKTGYTTIYEASFIVRLLVKNIGSVVEKDFKFVVTIPDILHPSEKIEDYLIEKKNGFSTYSFNYNSLIYPEETVSVKNFKINLNYQKRQIIRNTPIELALYYSGGVKRKTQNLNEILTINNVPLEQTTWGTK